MTEEETSLKSDCQLRMRTSQGSLLPWKIAGEAEAARRLTLEFLQGPVKRLARRIAAGRARGRATKIKVKQLMKITPKILLALTAAL
eukprot:15430569-Alexandrium_andersonii.AAC.1